MAYQRFKIPEMRLGPAAVAASAAFQPNKTPSAANAASAAKAITKNDVRPAGKTAATAATAARQEPEASFFAEKAPAVVMTMPAGDDPFETARTLLNMVVEKATADRSYRFRLVDQAEADRRNAEAVRNGSTDRYCACGALATFGCPSHDGRPVWRCLECCPAEGRA